MEDCCMVTGGGDGASFERLNFRLKKLTFFGLELFPSKDDRCVGGVDIKEVRVEGVGEELSAGSDCGRGGRRLREDAVGDGKCAADTSER